MDNRVNYISDKLVHLRGGLKSAREAAPSAPRPEKAPDTPALPVTPPPPVRESVAHELPLATPAAAPVSAPVVPAAVPKADSQAVSAQARRLEQTEQMYADLQQRMVRRRAQLDAFLTELQAKEKHAAELSAALNRRLKALPALRPGADAAKSATALGESYRAIDAEKLDYFALDAECERALLPASNGAASAQKAPEESFAGNLRKGWALALTLGSVIAAALLLASLILFAAWR